METNMDLAAPCGLYCGVCAVYIADRDRNQKFKERLTQVYGVKAEDIKCGGCLSDNLFFYCRSCSIRACTKENGFSGCHECGEFPCKFIDHFPLPVGKKVIMRSIPMRGELGTEKWMEEEEKRYLCSRCGNKLFRGARRCRECQNPVDVD